MKTSRAACRISSCRGVGSACSTDFAPADTSGLPSAGSLDGEVAVVMCAGDLVDGTALAAVVGPHRHEVLAAAEGSVPHRPRPGAFDADPSSALQDELDP